MDVASQTKDTASQREKAGSKLVSTGNDGQGHALLTSSEDWIHTKHIKIDRNTEPYRNVNDADIQALQAKASWKRKYSQTA